MAPPPGVLEWLRSFLISLTADGVGLNLTEADYCILLDPWGIRRPRRR
jgi:hypothetical protein